MSFYIGIYVGGKCPLSQYLLNFTKYEKVTCCHNRVFSNEMARESKYPTSPQQSEILNSHSAYPKEIWFLEMEFAQEGPSTKERI